MNKWLKEVLWFLGTLIVSYLIFDPGFTFNLKEATVDINVHDTYFVIEGFHVLVLITTTLFFFVYLVRMLMCRFKNLAVNILFQIANLLQILSLIGIINLLGTFIDMAGTTVYPPLSGPNVIHSTEEYKPIYYILISLQVLLFALEIFTFYKTISLYRKSKFISRN